MTRLFSTVNSDNRKDQVRITAHEEVTHKIYWGSAKDSKLACMVRVHWIKGEDKPTVVINAGVGVKIQ